MTVPYDAPHKQVSPACQATRPRPGAPDALAGAVLELPELPPGARCPNPRCPNRVRMLRAMAMVRDLAALMTKGA